MTTRSAEKTTEMLEKRFRKAPDSRLFSRLADAHRKEGNINRAIELCMDGIQKHPDYLTGHLILGRCFFEQQNFNEAFDEFKKVCTLDRHNQIAIKMLADIFVHQKMDKKAGNLYSILNKMDPYNKSLEKLASQFPCDGLSGLYDVLEINCAEEQIIWETASSEHETTNEPVAYGSGLDSDDFVENISPLQQSIDENQQFSNDFTSDPMAMNQINENTVAIDGDAISQQLNKMFEDDPEQKEDSQPSIQQNIEDEQDQTLFSDDNSDNSTDTVLNDNEEITGQDISSRIDELFSEKTDTYNNSDFTKMPELISEDDNLSIEQQVTEKTEIIDDSMISSEFTDQQSQSNFDSQTNQEPDLILEQPRPFDNLDPFTANNISSEFEETMQFERSFLDNVINSEEAVQSPDPDDKTNPFVSQDLIAEVSSAQEISMDLSTSDAFNPSEIISDSTQQGDISELKSQMSDLIDSMESADMPSEENVIGMEPTPEQLDDFDEFNLINDSGSIDNLPGVEALDQNPQIDSSDQTAPEELPDLIDEIEESPNSSPLFEENNDLLLNEIQLDQTKQPASEVNSDLIDSLEITDSGILDQENDLTNNLTENDPFAEIKTEITPDLPIVPEQVDFAPDDFLSLSGENNTLIDNTNTSSVFDLEQPQENITVEMSSESASAASIKPNLDISEAAPNIEPSISAEAEQDSDKPLTDEPFLKDQDDLAIIDADSEIDQLSVEHGDDVLTDMDVLVSDDALNSVSGDDIVEKMEMLFPDEKASSVSNFSETLPSTEKPVVQSGDLQIQEIQDSLPLQDDINDTLVKDIPAEDNSESQKQTDDMLLTQVDDEISLDIVSNDTSNHFTDDDDEQDSPSIISGQDIMERLDQFFPGNDLINNSSELSPAETNEENQELADFYTIFGDNAENAEPVKDLDGLDQVELTLSEDSEQPASFYDEWNDVCSLQDQSEDISFKEKLQQKLETDKKQSITVDHQQTVEQDDTNRPYTIPDHVLTPTLADIYYQQGQPDLAIQIYTRLLSRDPDNENLQLKLKQLKESIDSGYLNADLQNLQPSAKTESGDITAKKKKIVVDNRPLAGVRIKKRKSNGPNSSKNS